MNTNEIYERITATIIEMLEEHKNNNFSECWYSLTGEVFARNIVTNHVYNGINQLLLGYLKRKRNYPVNRWLTFKQIQNYNARIIKGSKTAMVVYTSVLYIDEKTGANITNKIEQMIRAKQSIEHLNFKKIGYLKDYRVFNVSCVEGLPAEFYEQAELDRLTEIEKDEKAEQLIKGTGANINFEAQNEAFYKPSEDKIYLPLPKQFISKEAFYNVVFHEMGHWTGAESRLNRPIKNKFGTKEYAFEELIAEINSAFIMAFLGYESRITDNVGYIENWLTLMKDDKKFVISAASQAQAAADFILQTANIKEIAA
ncbi:MAG TPA: zincin-like metallopeptidase domain-containing protein [Bacteroidales bacterium]|nr:zincin-like metallopeptidase domain-containing protein [Bacteroidales bacterium]